MYSTLTQVVTLSSLLSYADYQKWNKICNYFLTFTKAFCVWLLSTTLTWVSKPLFKSRFLLCLCSLSKLCTEYAFIFLDHISTHTSYTAVMKTGFYSIHYCMGSWITNVEMLFCKTHWHLCYVFTLTSYY